MLPVGAYGSQVHHAVADWANDGNTNVDDMALACGTRQPTRRPTAAGPPRINDRDEVEWTPPRHLDTGQSRINYYHRPELLLRPTNDDACVRARTREVLDEDTSARPEPFEPHLPDHNGPADGGKGVRGP